MNSYQIYDQSIYICQYGALSYSVGYLGAVRWRRWSILIPDVFTKARESWSSKTSGDQCRTITSYY